MSDIHIRRTHQLGLGSARAVARQWAEQVEREFSMVCTVIEGETANVMEFRRPGIDGRLLAAADHFDIEARLGFFLWSFRTAIEDGIVSRLDALLASESKAKRVTPTPAKSAVAMVGKRVKSAPPSLKRAKKHAERAPKT